MAITSDPFWFAPAEGEVQHGCTAEIYRSEEFGDDITISDGCESISVESKEDFISLREQMDKCARKLGWIV